MAHAEAAMKWPIFAGRDGFIMKSNEHMKLNNHLQMPAIEAMHRTAFTPIAKAKRMMSICHGLG